MVLRFLNVFNNKRKINKKVYKKIKIYSFKYR